MKSTCRSKDNSQSVQIGVFNVIKDRIVKPGKFDEKVSIASTILVEDFFPPHEPGINIRTRKSQSWTKFWLALKGIFKDIQLEGFGKHHNQKLSTESFLCYINSFTEWKYRIHIMVVIAPRNIFRIIAYLDVINQWIDECVRIQLHFKRSGTILVFGIVLEGKI